MLLRTDKQEFRGARVRRAPKSRRRDKTKGLAAHRAVAKSGS